ncbi:hypothetical protein KAR91_75055 [Candidatus Pacearchaeota archaeon]|nr:hypothetical protein [Candidatus Pacearchaeota archaeon]
MAGATKSDSDQANGQGDDKKSSVALEIERARKNGMNMLLPSTHIEGLSRFHTPVIDYVMLSNETADGDVYHHAESGKLVPTKQGLIKLSLCAGIMWNPVETRRVDNRSDRDYVSYRAIGGIRMADGTVVWAPPGEYDMDFEVIEDELRSQYDKAGKKRKKTGEDLINYVDYCVRRDLLYKRKHKIKLCESGAMNRVVRMLLGLKAGYTKAELSKPFVVARIIFKPDYSDPEARKIMMQKSIEALTSVYGASGDIPNPTTIPPSVDQSPVDPEQENPEDNNNDDDELTNEKADFLASDKDGKIDTLKKLAKRKGYDLKQLKKPLAQFEDNNLEAFFDKLTGMEDDDDIPF